MNALGGTIKTQWPIVSFEKTRENWRTSNHWFLHHISGMKANKNIISSVPALLGMSPPWPTR